MTPASTKFLGLPLPIWGIFALVLAVVWLWVWPSDRVALPSSLIYFILRWFHALVWLLLAVAAFCASFPLLGGVRTAKPVALLALIVYLVFMFTLVMSKKTN